MPSKPPKPQQAPFAQTNTYAPQSIAGTPEAQSFLDVPLDFGEPVDVDPGVGRRTDLAEQEIENRYNSAFGGGVPSFIREGNRARELRQVREQGAYETQQARFLNQQANNALRGMRTTTELGRRERLLPQILQTGVSGYGTQFPQSQPGFWQKLALTAAGGLSSAARFGAGG